MGRACIGRGADAPPTQPVTDEYEECPHSAAVTLSEEQVLRGGVNKRRDPPPERLMYHIRIIYEKVHAWMVMACVHRRSTNLRAYHRASPHRHLRDEVCLVGRCLLELQPLFLELFAVQIGLEYHTQLHGC